jgi:hypothetical protein
LRQAVGDLGRRIAGAHGLRRIVGLLDPPAFLPTAQKILSDAPLDYIVPRPPLEVCAARARDGAEGKIAKYDRGSYALFAAEERHVVSNESDSPKAIAEIIFKGLMEGRFRVRPATDPAPT